MAKRRKKSGQITYGAELGRKAIHLTSILIPIIAWFLETHVAVAGLALMAVISFGVDVERLRDSAVGRFLRNNLGFMIREHERDTRGGRAVVLSGSTWMLISAILTFAVFPKPIAVAAFAMLILCDTAAALIGRRFGTIRFGPRGKSLEGSLAFFVTGLLIAGFTPELSFLAGACGALAATLAEASPWEVDDNFSVPLAAGSVMVLITSLG